MNPHFLFEPSKRKRPFTVKRKNGWRKTGTFVPYLLTFLKFRIGAQQIPTFYRVRCTRFRAGTLPRIW